MEIIARKWQKESASHSQEITLNKIASGASQFGKGEAFRQTIY
ncbi:hypothetical protein QT972_17790 [Microcoleus sp. herbarium7]